MAIRSIISGVAFSALLFFLLVASRQMNSESEMTQLFSVDIVEIPDPVTAPELEEPEEEPEEAPQPPAPNIDFLDTPFLLDSPPVVPSPHKLDFKTPVETFQEASSVAPLPVRKVKKSVAPKKKYSIRSQYSVNELDAVPRVIRKGRFYWPRGVRGVEAKIAMRLKIKKSGHVEVLRIISSTNSDLNKIAMKVASQTRFTPPLKNGKPVEAVYTKTYLLKKR